MVVSTAPLTEIKKLRTIFRKERNRTLERYRFVAKKQQPNKTLRHFWNALTGDFGQRTESLIMDIMDKV